MTILNSNFSRLSFRTSVFCHVIDLLTFNLIQYHIACIIYFAFTTLVARSLVYKKLRLTKWFWKFLKVSYFRQILDSFCEDMSEESNNFLSLFFKISIRIVMLQKWNIVQVQAGIKHFETFLSFIIDPPHHKWNRTALLSAKMSVLFNDLAPRIVRMRKFRKITKLNANVNWTKTSCR